MRKFTQSLLLLIVIPLISCSTTTYHIPGVYRIDIQQGNIFDQNMIDQLRPNMTKRQVLYVMGSPMLIDIFHKNRWDYIYLEQLGGKPHKQQKLSLLFDKDLLVGVQGDYKPSALPVAKVNTETTIEVPKRQEKKTVFGEIVKFFSFKNDQPTTHTENKPDIEKQTTPEIPEPDSKESEPSAEESESNLVSTDTSINEPTLANHASTDADDKAINLGQKIEKQTKPTSNKIDELSKPPALETTSELH